MAGLASYQFGGGLTAIPSGPKTWLETGKLLSANGSLMFR
jgi:hypothetical protein